jgi:hypothetical protein
MMETLDNPINKQTELNKQINSSKKLQGKHTMAVTQGSNMKHQIKRILRSSALNLMLLMGLFGVNTAAMAAASVSLTSPAPNTKVAAPGSFVLTATASSTNSTVKKVDFYRGTTLLFTDTTAPYTYTWNNVAAGTYSITARVTDNKNAKATSAAVSVTVVNNVAPSVSLTSLAPNRVPMPHPT